MNNRGQRAHKSQLINYSRRTKEKVLCTDVAKSFYENDIPFNVPRSKAFRRMIESISNYGCGFKLPSYHEM